MTTVVAIGTDGTRSDPYVVQPRSPLWKELGDRPRVGARAMSLGIMYEVVPDEEPKR